MQIRLKTVARLRGTWCMRSRWDVTHITETFPAHLYIWSRVEARPVYGNARANPNKQAVKQPSCGIVPPPLPVCFCSMLLFAKPARPYIIWRNPALPRVRRAKYRSTIFDGRRYMVLEQARQGEKWVVVTVLTVLDGSPRVAA